MKVFIDCDNMILATIFIEFSFCLPSIYSGGLHTVVAKGVTHLENY